MIGRVLALAPLTGAAACGTGVAWEQELSGGYRLVAVDALEQMAIYSQPRDGPIYGGEVPMRVYQVAWDERHILAAQHPGDESFGTRVDLERTNYWVIEVGQRRVHGPLDGATFEAQRRELGVDPALELRRITKRLK